MGYIEKKVGFRSEKGTNHENNEDSIVCFLDEQKTSSGPEVVAAVIDGMGGYDGGSDASNFIKKNLEEFWKNEKFIEFAKEQNVSEDNIPLIYKLLIENINEKLYQHKNESQNKKMGSTFTGIVGYEMELYLAHVGDSRCYQFRKGRMNQLTEDHNMGTKIVKELNKSIDPIPEYYPLLYRSMGYKSWVKIDFQIINVEPNDFYLFCSDGVYQYVDQNDFSKILLQNDFDPQKVCDVLVDSAKKNGSQDDLSAVGLLYLSFMGLEMSKQEKTARLDF